MFKIENYGATPAMEANQYVLQFLASTPLPDDHKIDCAWEEVGWNVVLHPSAEKTTFGKGIKLSEAEASEVTRAKARHRLYIVARSDYRDVFGFKRREQVCLRLVYDAEAPRWEIANKHNEST